MKAQGGLWGWLSTCVLLKTLDCLNGTYVIKCLITCMFPGLGAATWPLSLLALARYRLAKMMLISPALRPSYFSKRMGQRESKGRGIKASPSFLHRVRHAGRVVSTHEDRKHSLEWVPSLPGLLYLRTCFSVTCCPIDSSPLTLSVSP